MSNPRCPSCDHPIPLRGSFSSHSSTRPHSDTCTSCGEEYPAHILPGTKPVEASEDKVSVTARWLRQIR